MEITKPGELLDAAFDDLLIARARGLCAARRRIDARLVALLVEIETRHVDLRAACSSLFDFCKKMLGMSDGAAGRHVAAVKLARRFPRLLDELAAQRLTLSSMLLLRGYLTNENADELLADVAGKSAEAVEALLLARAPKPDIPTMLTRAVEQAALSTAGDGATEGAAAARPRLQPLGEERYALQMTVSKALHEKLEHARALMSHRQPDGDLGVILERAVDLLIAKLEKERFATTSRPRGAQASSERASEARGVRSRRIPHATVRAVFERDGARCTFRDARGVLCGATERLELDHIVPHARGGTNEAANLRVRCHGHNHLHAVENFGSEHVTRKIQEERRTRALTSVRGALVNLGFGAQEAERALRAVTLERGGDVPPLGEVLREAIGVLT